MKNLREDRECELTIARELEGAMLEFVHLDKPSGDVPSRLRGKLGPIEFARGFTCWIAVGPVPLSIALELHEDPIGRRDVRVCGTSACPPQAPWIAWYTREGARVYPVEHAPVYRTACRAWPHIFQDSAPIVFHNEPETIGATPYIDLYHVDSEDGLRTFTGTLRKHGIDRLARPAWWEQHYRSTARGDALLAAAATASPVQVSQWDGDTQPLALDD